MSEVFKEAIANFLSPIKEHLDNPDVSEIMINGPFEIFIEKKGLVLRTDCKFTDEEALQAAMRSHCSVCWACD
jgi:pilus assembly protein CpaF